MIATLWPQTRTLANVHAWHKLLRHAANPAAKHKKADSHEAVSDVIAVRLTA